MAEGLWLVERTVDTGDGLIDGIVSLLLNDDDGSTSAQVIASAVARVNIHWTSDTGAVPKLPAGYFDTATLVSDLTTGPLKDDTDCYVFLPYQNAEKIENTES